MLRAAVIGLGIGEQHILGYEADPRCKVTTLCDIDVIKLTQVASRYPNRHITQHPSDVFADSDIDVVSIASYEDSHCDQVIAAIDSGKHVFVEKPLCLTGRELEQIVCSLRRNPKIRLSSNLILRKSPRFLQLREKISAGSFGELYYMEGDYDYGRLHKLKDGWRGRIPHYSVVHGGGIHLIDLLCWLYADKVEEVFAYGNKFFTSDNIFRSSDFVVAILKFRRGALAKVTANFGSVTPHFHRLAVYGTLATFQQSHSGANYFFSRGSQGLPIAISDDYPGTEKGDILPSFVRAILDGTPQDVTAEEVINAMSISIAIEKSVSTGRIEHVDYLGLERQS